MAAAGRRPGEIRSLRGFLAEHAEAVEADLLSCYRIDLRDLWRGGLSYRRLWVLLKHLPADSWTQTALRDSADSDLTELAVPERENQSFGPWALSNYQLAALTDEVAWLRFVVARTAGNKDYPEPKPQPRPGMRRPRRVQTEANVRYLNSLRATG